LAAREQNTNERAATALAKAVDQLKAALKRAQKARTLDQLRGHEGEGSAAYFGVLTHLVKTADFSFSKRVRRPPTDPVNALLSFGYTLLTTDLFGAVNVVGLDPYIGYLHAERYGRPSLPLDLMEEFRPIVVDSVVLTCLNKGILTRDDFTEGVGKVCALTDAGRERFLEQYEARKQTEFTHPVLKQTMTYQRCFEQQARFLGKTLQGELKTYPPLVVK
jgi:CRISPR-associated protein Cas1